MFAHTTPARSREAIHKIRDPFSVQTPADSPYGVLLAFSTASAGVVWANTFNKFDPASPFGGYKESGYGREGGRHGLEAYLDV